MVFVSRVRLSKKKLPKITVKTMSDMSSCPYCGSDIFVECRVSCLIVER